MTFSQRYKVRWSENERVDLPDLTAIDSLRDEDIANIVKALVHDSTGIAPPANARVMQGFTFTQIAALTVQLDNVECAAIDETGTVISRPAGSTVQLNMAPSSTNRISAYVDETPDITDNRRFIDPVTGIETVDSTTTRLGRFVNFYVTTVAFTNTAVIGGKTRNLVPLYEVVTGPATISAVNDKRALFGDPGTGETQAQAAALNLTSVRSWLLDIAARMKAITGEARYGVAPTQNLLSLHTAFDVEHNAITGAHENINAGAIAASGGVSAQGLSTFVSGIKVSTASPGQQVLNGYTGLVQNLGFPSFPVGVIRSSNNDGSVAYGLGNDVVLQRIGALVTVHFSLNFTFTGATGVIEMNLKYAPWAQVVPPVLGAWEAGPGDPNGWGAVWSPVGTGRVRFAVTGSTDALVVNNGVAHTIAGTITYLTSDPF